MGGIGIPRGGKKSRFPVIPTRCAMRCGASRSRPGCAHKPQGCRRSISGSWCVVRSMPWMAVAWAKGQEAAVTRSLIEQVLEMAGPQAISLLLADALYADGPLLAWLKYRKGIDALVSLPEDRLFYQDLQGLADGQFIDWTHQRYLRTIQGHKQVREVEVTAAGELTSWDGFTQAAASSGVPDA